MASCSARAASAASPTASQSMPSSAAAPTAEAAPAADEGIDWDAVGDAADAARAEHDAKRARLL